MNFPQQIFKAYDIRGLVKDELSSELAYCVGRALVALLGRQGVDLQGKSIVVGRDMRPSGAIFQPEVICGIRDGGMDAVDIGLVSTPLFNFTCASYPAHAAGIMVTASHNPAEYNGFKITLANGLPVPGKQMLEYVKEIGDNISVGKVAASPQQRRGQASPGGSTRRGEVSLNPLPDYLNKIFQLARSSTIKPLKAVIDFGNGMGFVTFSSLLKNLPQVSVEYLYPEPDGSFPNHEANPLKTETLRDLQNKVLETKADFGFALDGDADRVGVVDETGQVVEASLVGTLIGSEVLRLHPGGLMFQTPNCGMIMAETWRAADASVEMWQVGHANIKKIMKERRGIFGAELSLHLYFSDLYNLESSDLCFLYLLRIITRAAKPLSAITAPLKKYYHSGEINFTVADKDGAIARLTEKYRPAAEQFSTIDGIYLKFTWGWFNVRASNTEALLRLNVEANSAAMLKSKIEELSREITG